MDPFALALGPLFRAPGSAAAVYTGTDGVAVPIRVIVSQPDEERAIGQARILRGGLSLQIRVGDIAKPQAGALVHILDPAFGRHASGKLRLYGEPRLDTEGLAWTCSTEPAP